MVKRGRFIGRRGNWKHRSNHKVVIFLVFLGFLSLGAMEARNAATPASIDGLWKLTAEFPEYDLDAIVRFTTSKDGQSVEGIVLGPTSGRPSTMIGTMTGSQLSLTVPGPLGEMRVGLTYSDSTLSGTWAAADLTGIIRGTRLAPRKPEPTYYLKYFRWVYETLRDNFYDPLLNGVEIEKVGARYSELAANVRDDVDFVLLVRRFLGEFRTSHTDFYLAPEGAPIREKGPLVTWRQLAPDVNYVRIRHFDPQSTQELTDFDQALEKAAGSPSVVIDLRGNRGGRVGLAFRALSRFLEPGLDAIYVLGRTGTSAAASLPISSENAIPGLPVVPSSSVSWREIIRRGAAVIRIDGSPKRLYRGSTVLLVDNRCVSAGELFAAILRDRGGAVLIGGRTPGEVLGSNTYSVFKNMVFKKKDTGWRLEIPVVDFRTISGERIEGKGLTPDIEVRPGGADDAVVEEALRYLKDASAKRR
jgi:hypothetical protein